MTVRSAGIVRGLVPTLVLVGIAVVAAAATVATAAGDTPPTVPVPPLEHAETPVVEHVRAVAATVLAAPEDGAAWGRYGMVLQAHALDAEAIVAYEEAARRQPRVMQWPYFQAILVQETAPDAALELFDRAIALDPDYAATHIRRGLVLRGLGRVEDARADLAEALRLAPGNISAHIHMGQLQLAEGEVDAAIDHLRRARAARPRDATVLSALARALARRGDVAEARRLATEARGREPGRIVDDARFAAVVMEARTLQSFITRGEVILMEGDPEAAIAEIQRGLRLGHDPGSMYSTMARFRYAMRQPLACIEAADAAIAAGRGGTEVRQLRVMSLLRLGRVDEAAESIAEMLEMAPDDVAVRRLAAEVATARGDHRTALEHHDAVLARVQTPEDRRLRAATLVELGRNAEAIAELEALAGRDDSSATWLALGEARRAAGRTAAALEAYRSAEVNADGPMPGRRVAAMLMRQQSWVEAEARLRSLRARWPDDPNVINDLAWLLATCPEASRRRGPEAVALIDPLVRRTRRQIAPILDTSAAALAAAGRWDDAVATIDEALALLAADAADAAEAGLAAYRERRAAYLERRPWIDRHEPDA